MALPKKKKTKLDIDINPPKVGFDFLEYGMDRIEELMLKTDEKSVFLPKNIGLEDIDWDMYQYLDSNELKISIDGKNIPVIFLDNERWGEFSKTWKLMDEDKNVPTPYITIRRSEKRKGTRIGNKNRVPQNRSFRYVDVPILDEGQIINLRFKIPEPTNVDMVYDARLFTKYREDINKYDELIFSTFGSLQGYIFVKGNPMPVYLENAQEPRTLDNVDGDRFYVAQYQLLVKGFIQKEDEFEITKTSRKPRIGYDL